MRDFAEMTRGTRTDGWSPDDDLSARDQVKYDKWKHGILRKSARAKNRAACTEEKRETCDQIQGKLCTGDCPDGDVK